MTRLAGRICEADDVAGDGVMDRSGAHTHADMAGAAACGLCERVRACCLLRLYWAKEAVGAEETGGAEGAWQAILGRGRKACPVRARTAPEELWRTIQ